MGQFCRLREAGDGGPGPQLFLSSSGDENMFVCYQAGPQAFTHGFKITC